MSYWRPQQHLKFGQLADADTQVLANTEASGRAVVAFDPRLPPVFTLRHLAALARVDYTYLRSIITRRSPDPYRRFKMRKSRRVAAAASFRVICVPEPDLMRVQRWIARHILSYGRPHAGSYAYAPGSKIQDAAALHCGCSWLIKLDVKRFFESISEIAAYRAFLGLGYQPLVAFELTRICTRVGKSTNLRWRAKSHRYSGIPDYQQTKQGHLPQGAPTSPMLSNLTMFAFDEELELIARNSGLFYTRYADDITLSSRDPKFGRFASTVIIGRVYGVMKRYGLSPNRTKAQIVPPGARKIVLGLLVDGDRPRLSREFRENLRQHIYYLRHPEVGPVAHANRRGFAAVGGLQKHVEGLVRYARGIDEGFGASCADKLKGVAWP